MPQRGEKQIGQILSTNKLKALRMGYQQGKKALDKFLRKALPTRYALSAQYVNAILDVFYDDPDLPKDSSTSRPRLSAADRERCVIALLASRGERFNLALHMYLGLMNDLSAREIANILLLVGAYTGVDNFSNALDVEGTTLGVLESAAAPDPLTAVQGLKAAFAPEPAAVRAGGASGSAGSSRSG